VIVHDAWKPLYHLYAASPAQPELSELEGNLQALDPAYRLVNRSGTQPWWILWAVTEADAPVAQVELIHVVGDSRIEIDPSLDADTVRRLEASRAQYVVSVLEDVEDPMLSVQAALTASHVVMISTGGSLLDLSAQRVLGLEELQSIIERETFAIEDYVTLHLVTDSRTQRAWLHSHGMEKFGRSNLETFDLDLSVGRDAGKLLNELLLSAAMGSRPLLYERIPTPGGSVQVRPSGEVRPGITGVPFADYSGHEGPYLCLVSGDVHGDISAAVRDFLHRSFTGPADAGEAPTVVRQLLPLVAHHFQQHAPSSEFEYFARIPLSVQHGDTMTRESVWVRITAWQEGQLKGKLAADSLLDQEVREGIEVEFRLDDIETILLSVEGHPVAGQQLRKILEP
jgi:hypothetical protein